jgi:hypothetical protein
VTTPPNLDPLVGCLVTRVGLDYQVRLLLLSDDVAAELVIETSFTLSTPDGTWTVSPDDAGNYDRTPLLLRQTVEAVELTADEVLTLDLTAGRRVRVALDPGGYESWNLTGRGIAEWTAVKRAPGAPPGP